MVGLFDRFKNKTVSRVELVTERGNNFFTWNANVYQSDIVRACIAPRAAAIGKLVGKHIRETSHKGGETKIEVNPEVYMRFLLAEPNQLMTWDKFLEKLGNQLSINQNAFALIVRDGNGLPAQLYPINCRSAEAIYDASGTLYLRFAMASGKRFTFAYADVLHIREGYNDNDVFGTPIIGGLEPLMEIVTTTDQGIVQAIRNSAVIRWLLKFTSAIRPEDIEVQTKRFARSFLSVENGSGVAGVDSKAEATQIKPNDYVPNAAQMDRTVARIYALLGTNEKIVTSCYSEDDWNSYYEAKVEPVAICMRNEFTRKLFTRRERGCGNYIAFEAANLACASITTKLALVAMVDRMALTPNEWRSTLNLAPLPGGDVPLRRLDTESVTAAVDTRLQNLGLLKGGEGQ